MQELIADRFLAAGWIAGPISSDPTVPWEPRYIASEAQASASILIEWVAIEVDPIRIQRFNQRIGMLQSVSLSSFA